MGDVFLFEKENRIAGKLLAFRSVIKVWRFNAKTFCLFFFTIDTFTKLRLKFYCYPRICVCLKINELSEECQGDK